MNELKTCPCCGGKAKRKGAKYNLMGSYGTEDTERHWYGVYCTQCRLGQPMRYYFSREDSNKAWNTRTKERDDV